MDPTPDGRAAHPSSSPPPLPDPGPRFRVFYVTWRSCADWQTRGSLIRYAFLQWRRRTFTRREQ